MSKRVAVVNADRRKAAGEVDGVSGGAQDITQFFLELLQQSPISNSNKTKFIFFSSNGIIQHKIQQ